MNLSQPDSRACAFNHQVISPPTFQWLATWLLWSSGRQRGLLIVLEHWAAPLIFRVELLMKEKGGEGATGSHCPLGHQEDCSSSGYARVNHRNGFGGREPEFQSGVLPEDWWVHFKACTSPSKNLTRDLASVNSWLCLFKKGTSQILNTCGFITLDPPWTHSWCLWKQVWLRVEEAIREWGPHGPHKERVMVKKWEDDSEKPSGSLASEFCWLAATGHFLSYFFQAQSHRQAVGSFLFTYKGLHFNASESWESVPPGCLPKWQTPRRKVGRL